MCDKMAFFITEPLRGSNDVVVSVYKNTGDYVGNIVVDRVVFSAPPKDAGYLVEELMYEVGDIMWFCAGLARQFGWSLENVCWANLNKLSSRQERGVIEGDGDNR